jgi:NADPH-dependent glutamate synthase beta subunit-like oxidoreductase
LCQPRFNLTGTVDFGRNNSVEEMMNAINLNEIKRFVADKAWDTNKIRDFLKESGLHAEIQNKI